MFLFAHTGITLGVAELARAVSPRSHRRAESMVDQPESLRSRPDLAEAPGAALRRPVTPPATLAVARANLPFYLVLLVGSVLPDIVDKPLGLILMGDLFGSGRTAAHTAIFAAAVLLASLVLLWRRRTGLGLVLFYGVAVHFILDEMWRQPNVLWWPWQGWSFPHTHPPHLSKWLTGWLNQLATPHYYVPEVIGLLILAWFAWRLIRRPEVRHRGTENTER